MPVIEPAPQTIDGLFERVQMQNFDNKCQDWFLCFKDPERINLEEAKENQNKF